MDYKISSLVTALNAMPAREVGVLLGELVGLLPSDRI